jgi:4-alpha-glucanotransferase
MGIGEFSDLKKLIDWCAQTGLQMIQVLKFSKVCPQILKSLSSNSQILKSLSSKTFENLTFENSLMRISGPADP